MSAVIAPRAPALAGQKMSTPQAVQEAIAETVGCTADELSQNIGALIVTTSDLLPTNMAPESRLTGAFWNWFKGSKVAYDDGMPMVVYHGTDADIRVFEESECGWYGCGMYFTSNPETAALYAGRSDDGDTIMPVYLAIKNPYYYQEDHWDGAEEMNFRLIRELLDSGDAEKLVQRIHRNDDPSTVNDEIRERLVEMGHDGLIISSADGRECEYVVFHPEQIKSALGNRGSYSPNDPDIRFSLTDGIHAQGVHDPATATTYLLADRIPAGKEASVFLHEVVHRHGRSHLPDGQFGALVGQVKAWAGHAQGSAERSIHDKAAGRVAAAGVSGPVADEELFAYAVEEAVAMGVQPSAMAHEGSAEAWLSAVVQSIQRVADKLIGNSLEQLGGQDLVDLAYALAQLDRDEVSALIERELLLCGGIAYQPVASPDSEGLKADYPLASTSLMR